MRELIYGAGHGYPTGNEGVYPNTYRTHNRNVRDYFEGRGDVLVMDITSGDGWDELCSFLNLPVPRLLDFPIVNTREGAEPKWSAWGRRKLVKPFYLLYWLLNGPEFRSRRRTTVD